MDLSMTGVLSVRTAVAQTGRNSIEPEIAASTDDIRYTPMGCVLMNLKEWVSKFSARIEFLSTDLQETLKALPRSRFVRILNDVNGQLCVAETVLAKGFNELYKNNVTDSKSLLTDLRHVDYKEASSFLNQALSVMKAAESILKELSTEVDEEKTLLRRAKLSLEVSIGNISPGSELMQSVTKLQVWENITVNKSPIKTRDLSAMEDVGVEAAVRLELYIPTYSSTVVGRALTPSSPTSPLSLESSRSSRQGSVQGSPLSRTTLTVEFTPVEDGEAK